MPKKDKSVICEKPLSDEHKRKISEALIGRKMSAEACRKLGERSKGNQYGIGNKGCRGESNHEWKGDNVGKRALHNWVRRHRGEPSKCEHCGTESAGRFDWANVSKEYKRDLTDWIRLCRSCHTLYDKKGYKSTEFVEFNGERKSIADWGREKGIPYIIMWRRLKKSKMSIEQALTTPIKSNKKPLLE